MSTPQTQAIAAANTLAAIAKNLMAIYGEMNVLDAVWTDNGLATILANMQTATVAADGSLSTPDATPNTSHPIMAIGLGLSSTQFAQIKTIADAVVSLINSQVVTAQVGARGILNAAVGP